MILEIKGLNKYYGDHHVVKNLDLNIEEGEFITLLGPSGCGKTTILRMVGGFEKVSSGTIKLRGEDITNLPPYKRNVNTVFQNYALFPNMNVAENIGFGLRQKNISTSQTNKKVDEMLELIQLSNLGKRKPFELSGGQQQRVAIARAIANDPEILLLDEPLGALDLKLRKQMQSELKNLNKSLRKTFIYVTHDQEEALTMSDRIAVMNQGIIEQLSDGEQLYQRPNTRFIADFIGEANFLHCTKTKDEIEIDNQTCPLRAIGKSKPDGEYRLFFRPEDVEITAKDQGYINLIVKDIQYVGNKWRIHTQTRDQQKAIIEQSSHLDLSYTIDQVVGIKWNKERAILFN